MRKCKYLLIKYGLWTRRDDWMTDSLHFCDSAVERGGEGMKYNKKTAENIWHGHDSSVKMKWIYKFINKNNLENREKNLLFAKKYENVLCEVEYLF